MITGRIEQGAIKVGDEISIVGPNPIAKTQITGIEMFRKSMDSAQAGDNVGLLLRGLKRDDVFRGEVACKPNSVSCYKKFRAKVSIALKIDEYFVGLLIIDRRRRS